MYINTSIPLFLSLLRVLTTAPCECLVLNCTLRLSDSVDIVTRGVTVRCCFPSNLITVLSIKSNKHNNHHPHFRQTNGPVNEYPTMHNFGNSRHTQSMIADMILTDYFWKFTLKSCLVGMLLTCPITVCML